MTPVVPLRALVKGMVTSRPIYTVLGNLADGSSSQTLSSATSSLRPRASRGRCTHAHQSLDPTSQWTVAHTLTADIPPPLIPPMEVTTNQRWRAEKNNETRDDCMRDNSHTKGGGHRMFNLVWICQRPIGYCNNQRHNDEWTRNGYIGHVTDGLWGWKVRSLCRIALLFKALRRLAAWIGNDFIDIFRNTHVQSFISSSELRICDGVVELDISR